MKNCLQRRASMFLMFMSGVVACAELSAQDLDGWSEELWAPVIQEVQDPAAVRNKDDSGEIFKARDNENEAEDSEDQNNFITSQDISEENDWLSKTRVGYDGGFVIANTEQVDLGAGDLPFSMRINGWGQLRHSIKNNRVTEGLDLNQFQLKRGRLVFAGSAFTEDFAYFVQIDGRSSSGDDVRLLDFVISYDIGRHRFGKEAGTFGFKTGKYKMPFTMARYLSGREFEFADRSMASTYFDVNRSFAWGLFGKFGRGQRAINWEAALFNGLVTGGAETGSAGELDENFASSLRIYTYPTGEWGEGELADFDGHCQLATRMGFGFADSKIDRSGQTEFDSVRVVDSGERLSNLLPDSVNRFDVLLFSIDGSLKYRGWSASLEYYFRNVEYFDGVQVPDLFDHGHWMQLGKFIVPGRFQLFTRWSRVAGNSGTLGLDQQSSDEVAGGFAWYFRGDQHAKLVVDMTDLDGAPIRSSSLDISPGDDGWLMRTQIQFAF